MHLGAWLAAHAGRGWALGPPRGHLDVRPERRSWAIVEALAGYAASLARRSMAPGYCSDRCGDAKPL